MAKTPCKSIKRDGSPCNGKGLEQFDGYCIAHGPADQTRQWRALGGTNSSTAARLDKRIPARLKNMMDMLEDGMNRVLEGTLTPAAYTAMCRGAKVRIDLYRLADEEMEAIRAEENQAAAAETAGAHGDLAILKAADHITAQQNQYRIQSLIDQDLVSCKSRQTDHRPAEYALTDEGRKCFDYRITSSCTQEHLDDLRESLANYTFEGDDFPDLLPELEDSRIAMEAALADLTRDRSHDPDPPRDPLTGQTLNHPPAGVRTGAPRSYDPAAAELSLETLQDYIRQHDEIYQEAEKLSKDLYYDVKRDRFLQGKDPETHTTTITVSKDHRK